LKKKIKSGFYVSTIGITPFLYIRGENTKPRRERERERHDKRIDGFCSLKKYIQ
jgi:hypothetical protein